MECSVVVISSTLQRLREHLGLDVAYINELDGDDLIVRALCSPDSSEELQEQITVPRENSFCHYMVQGDIPNIIHDSSEHPITRDVHGRHNEDADINARSYIGIPLNRPDGSTYGSICCVGNKPNHTLNERDLRSIQLFAEIVVEQIDGELEDRKLQNDRLGRIEAVIATEDFELHFQPIIDLSEIRLKGFEVLTRFQPTPYRSPDKWFAEADAVGLGVELELAVLRKALKLAPELPEDLSLGLNLSPECLMSEGLLDSCFDRSSDRFIFEMTEHVAVRDYPALIGRILHYKTQGVRIAGDDAGAGYSSLSHIVQLQPDLIKLDMTLTQNINKDPIRRSLANALVYFAKDAGAEIVAEGVETSLEHDTLAALGAHYGQGYFYSKPMPLEEAKLYAEQAYQDQDLMKKILVQGV